MPWHTCIESLATGWIAFDCASLDAHKHAVSSGAMKTIKDMPERSRPREKLREKGASALTDEELIPELEANRKLAEIWGAV